MTGGFRSQLIVNLFPKMLRNQCESKRIANVCELSKTLLFSLVEPRWCSRQVHVLADTDIALARAQHSLHTGPAALQATSHYMYSITQALQHYRPQAIICSIMYSITQAL